MNTIRSIETIKKFPINPDGHVVYVVYNEDVVRATEILITELHGQKYFDNHVDVTFIGGSIPEKLAGKRCILYFDPAVHEYNGNGYN